MEKLDVKSIKIGKRHRQDMGDLAVLARSIQEVGLLQPIGVDDKNNLVFGQRRLMAVKELKWDQIPAIRINLESIVAGEFHENEMRKSFTITERTAIGMAIEEIIGNRQGKRTDRELPLKLAEVDSSKEIIKESGKETVQEAAEQAGFKSKKTYQDAKTIVKEGTPELREAVDAREVSIADAAAIAEEPAKVQRQALKDKKEGKARTLRQAVLPILCPRCQRIGTATPGCEGCKEAKAAARKKKEKKPETTIEDSDANEEVIKDHFGKPVPENIREVFTQVGLFKGAMQKLSDVKGTLTAIKDHKAGCFIDSQETERLLTQARSNLRFAMPYTECPKCRRKLEKSCKACKGLGWVAETMYSSIVTDADKAWLEKRT